MGESEQALQSLATALQINPNFAPAKSELGVLFLHEGMLADADAAFDAALKDDPSDAIARQNSAIVKWASRALHANVPRDATGRLVPEVIVELYRVHLSQQPDSPIVTRQLAELCQIKPTACGAQADQPSP